MDSSALEGVSDRSKPKLNPVAVLLATLGATPAFAALYADTRQEQISITPGKTIIPLCSLALLLLWTSLPLLLYISTDGELARISDVNDAVKITWFH